MDNDVFVFECNSNVGDYTELMLSKKALVITNFECEREACIELNLESAKKMHSILGEWLKNK